MLFDRVEEMDFENRVFNFNDPFIRDMYDSAESMVINKIETFDKNH